MRSDASFFAIFNTYLRRHFAVICLKPFHKVEMSPSVSKVAEVQIRSICISFIICSNKVKDAFTIMALLF